MPYDEYMETKSEVANMPLPWKLFAENNIPTEPISVEVRLFWKNHC